MDSFEILRICPLSREVWRLVLLLGLPLLTTGNLRGAGPVSGCRPGIPPSDGWQECTIHGCCQPGFGCYSKNNHYYQCKPSCTQGSFWDPWDCEPWRPKHSTLAPTVEPSTAPPTTPALEPSTTPAAAPSTMANSSRESTAPPPAVEYTKVPWAPNWTLPSPYALYPPTPWLNCRPPTTTPPPTEAPTVPPWALPLPNRTLPLPNGTSPLPNGTQPLPPSATSPHSPWETDEDWSAPPAFATLPPPDATLPPPLTTEPPLVATLPPTEPPEFATLPPIFATLPPADATLPPPVTTLPSPLATLPPTLPPPFATLPPALATQPPPDAAPPPLDPLPPPFATLPPVPQGASGTVLPTPPSPVTQPPDPWAMNGTLPIPRFDTLPPMLSAKDAKNTPWHPSMGGLKHPDTLKPLPIQPSVPLKPLPFDPVPWETDDPFAVPSTSTALPTTTLPPRPTATLPPDELPPCPPPTTTTEPPPPMFSPVTHAPRTTRSTTQDPWGGIFWPVDQATTKAPTTTTKAPGEPFIIDWEASGTSFFEGFEFLTEGGDRGAAEYVASYEEAQEHRVAKAFDTHAILRAGKLSSWEYKRTTFKIGTKKAWKHFLVAMRFSHLPWGCGVHPAFFTLGTGTGIEWPGGGEMDILEYVNDDWGATSSLHTNRSCTLDPDEVNKYKPMPDQNHHNNGELSYNCETQYCDGCTSFGCAPNAMPLLTGKQWADRPGVLAMQRSPSFAKVFYIPEEDIPETQLEEGFPSPSTWNEWLIAYYPFKDSPECPFAHEVMAPQRMFLNIALCGDWAGKAWGQSPHCREVAGRSLYYNDRATRERHQLDQDAYPGQCRAVDPMVEYAPEQDCCTTFIAGNDYEHRANHYLKERAFFNISWFKVFI